jgi:hypothetical protein
MKIMRFLFLYLLIVSNSILLASWEFGISSSLYDESRDIVLMRRVSSEDRSELIKQKIITPDSIASTKGIPSRLYSVMESVKETSSDWIVYIADSVGVRYDRRYDAKVDSIWIAVINRKSRNGGLDHVAIDAMWELGEDIDGEHAILLMRDIKDLYKSIGSLSLMKEYKPLTKEAINIYRYCMTAYELLNMEKESIGFVPRKGGMLLRNACPYYDYLWKDEKISVRIMDFDTPKRAFLNVQNRLKQYIDVNLEVDFMVNNLGRYIRVGEDRLFVKKGKGRVR